MFLMKREIYKKIDGVWRWVTLEDSNAPQAAAPFVHQDTLKQPLRHLVTGEMCDSASRMRQLDRQSGVRCVGNDLASKRPDGRKDKITDEVIRDRIERAESIADNPDKLRERQGEIQERMERVRKYLNVA